MKDRGDIMLDAAWWAAVVFGVMFGASIFSLPILLTILASLTP